jgi:hypothetical protein
MDTAPPKIPTKQKKSAKKAKESLLTLQACQAQLAFAQDDAQQLRRRVAELENELDASRQTLEVLFGRTKLSADEIAVNTDAGLLDPTAREGEYRAEAERLLGEALQHAELKSRE